MLAALTCIPGVLLPRRLRSICMRMADAWANSLVNNNNNIMGPASWSLHKAGLPWPPLPREGERGRATARIWEPRPQIRRTRITAAVSADRRLVLLPAAPQRATGGGRTARTEGAEHTNQLAALICIPGVLLPRRFTKHMYACG